MANVPSVAIESVTPTSIAVVNQSNVYAFTQSDGASKDNSLLGANLNQPPSPQYASSMADERHDNQAAVASDEDVPADDDMALRNSIIKTPLSSVPQAEDQQHFEGGEHESDDGAAVATSDQHDENQNDGQVPVQNENQENFN